MIAIYDNNGKTIDSITIVFLNTKERSIFAKYDYKCLCSSYNGVAFFQHSNCSPGAHLGKKVKFSDLHIDLQSKLCDYFFNEGVQYHRKPTKGEIKFGEGATHYKTFDSYLCEKNGRLKNWIICPVDGLRYYL